MRTIVALGLALILCLLCVNAAWGEENTGSIAEGDTVFFGVYPQTAEGNDRTPIEWIVLEVRDGKALLLSKYGLDVMPYNMIRENTTWENCSLRAWLNGEFLENAFSPEEQAAILATEVDNSAEQGYGKWAYTEGGNGTEDRVFLLSYAEASWFLNVTYEDKDNTESRAAPTAYALARGAWKNDEYRTADGSPAGWWWLRSPGGVQDSAAYVSCPGALFYYFVNDMEGTVRPALWMNLDE